MNCLLTRAQQRPARPRAGVSKRRMWSVSRGLWEGFGRQRRPRAAGPSSEATCQHWSTEAHPFKRSRSPLCELPRPRTY